MSWELPRFAPVLAQDTAHLERLRVSEALLGDVARLPNLELLGGPVSLEFDAEGTLRTWAALIRP